jgi:hypothetical protein
MAETPLPPDALGSPEPTGSTGAPSEPAAEGPALSEVSGADGSPELTAVEPAVDEPALEEPAVEEPAVEGWSGTPVAVCAEEAIARPDPGPIELSLTPAAAPPEPEPEPEPAPTPTIASTLEIPPAPGATPAEGGEFDLLVEKLRAWFAEADIGGHWQKLRGPLKGFALLLVAVLALRLYARVVGTLDGIPLVSGLLELTGLIYLVWFSSTRLVRTSERERVLAEWKQRWQSFSGRS